MAAAGEPHSVGPTGTKVTEPVNVVPYDPDWPRRFAQECAVLCAVFAGSEAAIEHVGSTAVPGLGAKPVIDVMVGLSQLAEAEGRIAALETAGYEYVQKYEGQLPERRYFRKPWLGPRAYHLHCVVKGSDFWVRHLAFRDYLRAHLESAAAYYELKGRLAARCSKEDYTEAKSQFIEWILVSALGHDGQRPAQQRVAPGRPLMRF
jgi:GrpB-like predicted nucleotidyltransferase (UPF0157 family)